MLLIGLAVAGLCLIAWGATSVSPFLTSLGGALFGSCLGALIGRVAKRDLAEQINKTVRESLYPGFTTDESKIAGFRQKWHIYHVTEMEGKFVWRHAVADFRKNRIPGRLIAETTSTDKRGGVAKYIFEGGIRDERLVLIIKAIASEERSAIYIFPFAGLTFEDRHFGILFLQTYDATNSISPTLITRDPIPEALNEGTISDLGATVLDAIWVQRAEATSSILPRIITFGLDKRFQRK